SDATVFPRRGSRTSPSTPASCTGNWSVRHERAARKRSPPGGLHESAVRQAALVRAGDVSARELIQASLAAIDERDGELGAFVHRCGERALTEADAIRPGDPRPLCGVPIALKDLISATEGLPTTHGSHAFGDWVSS